MKMVEVTCRCGTKFQAREADVNRGWAKCCSKSCAATVREKKIGTYKRICNVVDYSEANADLYCDNFEQSF